MSNLVIRIMGGGNINGGAGDYSRQFWWALYLRAKVGKAQWILC